MQNKSEDLKMDRTDALLEKPMLIPTEMIDHLEGKGVRFDLCSKESAIAFLKRKNNYFKLTAYRKNYPKHPDGANKGKYIDLDFEHLVELSKMDCRLRYAILPMSLDIEHHLKTRILTIVENGHRGDAYSIVREYICSLDEPQKTTLKNYIDPAKNLDIYRCSLINKHRGNYPIWAFVEIIPFSELIYFYTYVLKKYTCEPCELKDKSDCFGIDCIRIKRIERMKNMLNSVRSIRNAAAHNSCILNDLSRNSMNPTAQLELRLHLYKFMNAKYAQSRLTCARVQQLITLLYIHDTLITSDEMWHERFSQMKDVITTRFFRHREYFNTNYIVADTLEFLKYIVDNWQRTC
jgi:abortive infection bacteriophage resistance protein